MMIISPICTPLSYFSSLPLSLWHRAWPDLKKLNLLFNVMGENIMNSFLDLVLRGRLEGMEDLCVKGTGMSQDCNELLAGALRAGLCRRLTGLAVDLDCGIDWGEVLSDRPEGVVIQ